LGWEIILLPFQTFVRHSALLDLRVPTKMMDRMMWERAGKTRSTKKKEVMHRNTADDPPTNHGTNLISLLQVYISITSTNITMARLTTFIVAAASICLTTLSGETLAFRYVSLDPFVSEMARAM
jgi:hypothetical protein